MNKFVPLPHHITEDVFLECAVMWSTGDKLNAVKKWRDLNHLSIDLAKESLEYYLKQFELF